MWYQINGPHHLSLSTQHVWGIQRLNVNNYGLRHQPKASDRQASGSGKEGHVEPAPYGQSVTLYIPGGDNGATIHRPANVQLQRAHQPTLSTLQVRQDGHGPAGQRAHYLNWSAERRLYTARGTRPLTT